MVQPADYNLRFNCIQLVWDNKESDEINIQRAELVWLYVTEGFMKANEKSEPNLNLISDLVAKSVFRKS